MKWRRWATTIVVTLVGLVPLGLILRDWWSGALVEPVKEITHRTGWWTLFLLSLTLGVTPARRWTGWHALIRQRRTLGLLAFTYATLHFLTYLVLDQFFAWSYIWEDIAKRPYITVGFTAWLLLIPLAVTSTKGWIRRLGRRWGVLHRLVYVVAALGVLHFLWLVKADVREPVAFGLVLVGLLTTRLARIRSRQAPRPARAESQE